MFDWIFFILASKEDNHISDGIEIRPNLTMDCGVSCPRASVKFPHYRRRIAVATLMPSLLNGSSLFLQVTWTTIKAWVSSNFGQIPSLSMDLAALERLKNCCIML